MPAQPVPRVIVSASMPPMTAGEREEEDRKERLTHTLDLQNYIVEFRKVGE